MASFRGKKCCSCLAKWLPVYEAELLRRGVIRYSLDVYQLTGTAKASAGTHAGGGAFDLAQTSPEAIKVARQMGADATWHRRKSQGFTVDHAHGVLRGCPHNAPARYQITAVDLGYNGLGPAGRGGRDDGPRPLSKRTWSQGIAWAKTQATPKPKPKPVKKKPAHGVIFLNVKGGDDAGKATFRARAPKIAAAVAEENTALFIGVELPVELVPVMDAAMAAVGYRRIAWGRSAFAYARSHVTMLSKGGGKTIVLDKQNRGRDEAVLLFAVQVNGQRYVYGVTHLDVYATDKLRVAQATEAHKHLRAFARWWRLTPSFEVLAMDHNTPSGAVTAALAKLGRVVAVQSRRCAIYLGKNRPKWSARAIEKHLSDHPMILTYLARKA